MQLANGIIGISLFASVSVGLGQDASPDVRFEVASVKPAGAGLPAMRGGPGSGRDPDRITYKVSLKRVLMKAYDVKIFQIAGPDWLDSSLYDVVANVPHENLAASVQSHAPKSSCGTVQTGPASRKPRVPNLQLGCSQGGPKLKVSEHPGTTEKPSYMRVTPLPEGARAVATGTPLSGLALLLGDELDGFVVSNKTGLDETYDFTLEFAPRSAILRDTALRKFGLASPGEFSFPALLTAVQEQLGLRLEKSKAPYDVLVIDQADKVPTEN